jgi:hypothetical protein
MNNDLITDLVCNSDFLSEFSQKSTSWGIAVVPDPLKPCVTRIVRCSLVPRLFSKILYDRVSGLCPVFHKLIDSISLDLEWLTKALRGMFDAFINQVLI